MDETKGKEPQETTDKEAVVEIMKYLTEKDEMKKQRKEKAMQALKDARNAHHKGFQDAFEKAKKNPANGRITVSSTSSFSF
jgi:flagellar biosynthesis/type III secretory pathway protein FliH